MHNTDSKSNDQEQEESNLAHLIRKGSLEEVRLML